MPRISAFYGISIYMYWNEGDHQVPHFHAHHGGRRASLSLEGAVLAGEVGARELGLIREWAQLHGDELLANWERARNAEILVPIEPLP
ncbi:MAG: DUF4160 domain-containing protein [Candidatus Dormiibacterota bacterium]